MNGELIYKEEVYRIIGAAIEVHRHLRSGFLEAVYQEAMEIELALRGTIFQRQAPLKVFYNGVQLKKDYTADFICYGQILIELKVADRMTSKERSQLLNYMNATRLRVGLLINFGDPGRLDWQRFVL